jgi:hypothetical protein
VGQGQVTSSINLQSKPYRKSAYVCHPKILRPNNAAKLEQKHGSPLPAMDGAVPLRVGQIGLGDGWDTLEGSRATALVLAMPQVWQAIVAQGFQGGTDRVTASRVR